MKTMTTTKLLGMAFTMAVVATSAIALTAASALAVPARGTALPTRGATVSKQQTSSTPPMSCSVAIEVSKAYIAAGEAMLAVDEVAAASNFFGKAEGVVQAACGS